MLKTTVFHKIPHELSLQGHMRALNHGKRLFLMLTFVADTCSCILITTNASFLSPLWLRFCFSMNLEKIFILVLWHKCQGGERAKKHKKYKYHPNRKHSQADINWRNTTLGI